MNEMNSKLVRATFGAVFIALLCAGCDYVPRTTYEIETKDGQVLILACPVLDRERSEITYLLEGSCVIYK